MRITHLWRAQQPLILYLAAVSNGEFCHNFISASNNFCQHGTALHWTGLHTISIFSTAIVRATFLVEIKDEDQCEDTGGSVE